MSLTKLSLADLDAYKIPEARKVPVRPGVEFYSDWLDRSELPKEELVGFPTSCWAMFNEWFGGARSELVMLSGETGMGKTSWGLTWLKDTLDQNRGACLIPMEMGPSDSIDHLAEMVLGKKNYQASPLDKTTFGKHLEQWPLFLVDHDGPLEEARVEAAIYYTALEKNVKFFMIDHLEYIQKKQTHRNEAYTIDDCVRSLGHLAKHLNVTILLLSHPAKRDKSERGKVLHMGDLKGTSGIAQTGGSVLIHHRPDGTTDETWIHLAKIRSREYSKNRDKKIRFGFDSERSLYAEAHRD